MFLVKKSGYSEEEMRKVAEIFRDAHREISKYCYGTSCSLCEHRRLCRDLKATADWLEDRHKEMLEEEVTSRGMRVQEMP